MCAGSYTELGDHFPTLFPWGSRWPRTPCFLILQVRVTVSVNFIALGVTQLCISSTEPDAGLELTDHEIMTSPPWATQAPCLYSFQGSAPRPEVTGVPSGCLTPAGSE